MASEIDEGSQVKVSLPKIEKTSTPEVEDGEIVVGQGELILIVDDEDAVREITKTVLETHNYKVLTASNGNEAIAIYIRHQDLINIVLTDMMMPFIDGSTIIRTLEQINPQIKIIAVSGLESNDKIALAAGTSVKKFLSKPYTIAKLLKTIEAVKSSN